MNKKLQNILNLIEQNKNLTAEEKESALKALKDADKELEITAFKLERTEKVKKTTAILLEETIEELEQKRKAVEAQNRELEIEASLERVRAVAMSMNKSDDLLSICEVSFNEFKKLGFNNLRNSLINIFNDEEESFVNYDYSDYLGGSISNVSYNSNPANDEFLIQIRKANDAFVETVIDRNKLDEWKEFRRSHGEQDDPRLDNINALYYYNYSIGSGSIGISNFNPISEEQQIILKRFRNVFNLSYQRYLDIALAEEQAREAQIEASLERVRAVAMSMNKSEDLLSICEVSFKEFKKLGFDNIRNALIHIQYDEQKYFMDYDFSDLTGGAITKIEYGSHPVVEDYLKQISSAKDAFYQGVIEEDQLEEWKDFRKNSGQIDDPRLDNATALYYYFFSIGVGDIGISTLYSIDESQIKILKRFRNVFDLAYRRYNDITIAEAQAREAQIEAALERVRSKTMAMHNSQDVGATVVTLFDEVLKLGLDKSIRVGIGILEGNDGMETWSATSTPEGKVDLKMGMLDMTIHPMLIGLKKAWESGETSYSYDYIGDDVFRYYEALNNEPEYPFQADLDLLPENEYHKSFFYKEGILFSFAPNPISDEAAKVLDRFAGVFGQTYRRYLDLQKAEAQAREAQIEAALERVRARTMAMHKSDELAETAGVLFEQMVSLGIVPKRCVISIINQTTDNASFWLTSSDGKVIPGSDLVPLTEEKHLIEMYRAWKDKKTHFSFKVSAEERLDWTTYIINKVKMHLPEYQPDTINKEQILNEPAVFNSFFFSHGFVMLHTVDDLTEDHIKMLNRFASVFEQTYTRFLDLKRAEAQAREAKIETSLERVRSKAMAMHSPNDLSETLNVFFKELKALEIVPLRCGVAQIDEATRTTNLTTTTSSQQGDSFEVIGKIKQTGHPVLDGIFENWKLQKEYYPVLEGADIKAYYDVMNAQIAYPDYSAETTQFGNLFPFKEGFVFAWTESKLSKEDLQIFRRFNSVLSLTYRRYIDLKEAKARSVEAVRQASLDRVRAEIASMRTTNDLEKITPLIWRELTTLGIPFFRCGVFIIDEPTSVAHAYLSTPLGKSLAALHVKIDNTWLENAVKHWRNGEIYHEVWDRNKFLAWTQTMMEQGFVENKEQFQAGKEAPETLSLQLLPFTQGMLYVGSKLPLSNEEIKIAGKLADDFGIAYSRYEDFQKLEAVNHRKTLELEEARQLQLSMLPKELPKLPNLDIAVYMKTATEVGGDYYDFNVGVDETLTVAIGDATGHGMKAGTIVSMIKALFASGGSRMDMKSYFKASSDALKGIELGRLMMAFLMLRINSHKLQFANAAMPPLYIYKKQSKEVEEIMISGMPLGAIKDFPYQVREIEISAGDTILLLSDGLPELKNSKDEHYGYGRVKDEFKSVAEKRPDEIVGYLKNSAAEWVNGIEPDDDVTFVVIKVK